MMYEIEIQVNDKNYCWCDIHTLEECLREARYHYPNQKITWGYC